MVFQIQNPKGKKKKSKTKYQVNVYDAEKDDIIESKLFNTKREAKIYTQKQK